MKEYDVDEFFRAVEKKLESKEVPKYRDIEIEKSRFIEAKIKLEKCSSDIIENYLDTPFFLATTARKYGVDSTSLKINLVHACKKQGLVCSMTRGERRKQFIILITRQ